MIGAVFPRATAAQHRLVRGGDNVGIEALTLVREAFAIELRICARARAGSAMPMTAILRP
jgi:hypothetical protein